MARRKPRSEVEEPPTDDKIARRLDLFLMANEGGPAQIINEKVRAAKGLKGKWTVIDSHGATEAAERHLAHLQDMHERNKRRR